MEEYDEWPAETVWYLESEIPLQVDLLLIKWKLCRHEANFFYGHLTTLDE